MDQFFDPREKNFMQKDCEKFMKRPNWGPKEWPNTYDFCCVKLDFCAWYQAEWVSSAVVFGTIGLVIFCFIMSWIGCCIMKRRENKQTEQHLKEREEEEAEKKRVRQMKWQKYLAKKKKMQLAKPKKEGEKTALEPSIQIVGEKDETETEKKSEHPTESDKKSEKKSEKKTLKKDENIV